MCQRPLEVLRPWQKKEKWKLWRGSAEEDQLEAGKIPARMGVHKAWPIALPDGGSSAFWLWRSHNKYCQFEGGQESQEWVTKSQSSVGWCWTWKGVTWARAVRNLRRERRAVLFSAAQKTVGMQSRNKDIQCPPSWWERSRGKGEKFL